MGDPDQELPLDLSRNRENENITTGLADLRLSQPSSASVAEHLTQQSSGSIAEPATEQSSGSVSEPANQQSTGPNVEPVTQESSGSNTVTQQSSGSHAVPILQDSGLERMKNSYPCHLCIKTYKTKGNLDIHLRCHVGEKRFKCFFCNDAFDQKTLLTTHMKKHGKIGSHIYQCPICSINFSNKGTLQTHLNQCNPNPYIHGCSFCERTFKRKGHLTEHLRIHSGIKRYKCNVCHYSSCSKSNVNRHKKTHLRKPEVEWSCKFCGKKYKRACHLSMHLKTHNK